MTQELLRDARVSKFNGIRRGTSTLPAPGQVMLTADFRFKIAGSVTQAARLTAKMRQVTAERRQKLPRSHALYKLNVSRRSYLSRTMHQRGKACVSRMYVHAHHAFTRFYLPPELARETGRLTDTEDTMCFVLCKLLILAQVISVDM